MPNARQPSLDVTIPGSPQTEDDGGRHAMLATGSIEPGGLIGRYVVLARLGTGAMGVVYATYDPQLDRKVALKLLKPRGGDPTDARARLQREAQALAKLDHRNVVTVYDVGVHEGQLFVSMEFVEGQTLGAWMQQGQEAEGPWPWREVLSKFVDAGRGLAAAHAAGLVHRDFKPDNVMLGDDDRVRVMDFGLARGEEEGQIPNLESAQGVAATLLLSHLTQTGAILGTPAYMALEQFSGAQANARSDQFGFCVALYEALYGERPFAGRTVGELVGALQAMDIRPAAKRTKVPSWVHHVVLRGLAKHPEDRWSSMQALLEALTNDPVVRRRRWAAAVVAAGVLAGGAWAVGSAAARDAETCANMDQHLVEVWDDARRRELEFVFEQTELAYAADSWKSIEPSLDRYAATWVEARTEACEATHRGEQSGKLLDLRMACLDERLVHLRATIDVLARGDETVVGKAVEAVGNLPRLERCADIDALTAAIPPPEQPEVARRVERLMAQLAEAEALAQAGKYAEGLALASMVRVEAEDDGYEPLLVRAGLVEGELQDETGDYERAEATLRRVYASALGLGMLAEAAHGSALLIGVVGFELARHADGRRWAEDAEPLARAAGTDEARATYFSSLATVAMSEGAYAEAKTLFERSRAIWEQSQGPNDPHVATALSSLGIVAHLEGAYLEARSYLERSQAIRERTLGRHHPDIAYSLSNLGAVAKAMGAHAEARAYHERALEIFEEVYGRSHTVVATSLNNLGVVAVAEGAYAEGRVYHERSLAIFEEILGPDHPSVASALSNLGAVAVSEGAYAEARAYHERALAIQEETLDRQHPSIAASLVKLGEMASAEEDFAQARGYYERALAIREQAFGPEHPDVAKVLVCLGRAHLDHGEAGEAVPYLERAQALQIKLALGAEGLAEARFALARALWDAPTDAGRDRVHAEELGELAREAYEADGVDADDQLAKLEAWQTTLEG